MIYRTNRQKNQSEHRRLEQHFQSFESIIIYRTLTPKYEDYNFFQVHILIKSAHQNKFSLTINKSQYILDDSDLTEYVLDGHDITL